MDGEFDVIDELIDKVDINCTLYNGETALILVCRKLHPWTIDVICKLLQHNIDVDHRSDTDVCALQYVLMREDFDPQIASLILMASSKGINHTNKAGQSYLWCCNTLESYQFVVESGVDINLVSQYQTILNTYHMKYKTDKAIRRYLIASGAKTKKLLVIERCYHMKFKADKKIRHFKSQNKKTFSNKALDILASTVNKELSPFSST